MLMNLEKNKSIERISYYKEKLSINDNDYVSCFNLAEVLWQNLQLEEAIYYFKKSLKINPQFKKSEQQLKKAIKEKKDLITYLSYINPKEKSSNVIIKSNQRINNIKYNIDLDKKISDDFIYSTINKTQNIMLEENLDTECTLSQIYRVGIVKYYDCNRYKKIFNTFNVIPENCFSCFKIQIERRDVIELIKLYFVFSQFDFKFNLTRKCMIELRKYVSGSAYKGLIYCIGLDQANETLDFLSTILNKTIHKEIPRFIKRGCTEYGMLYPEYKEIDPTNKNFMKYKSEWKIKEEIFDKKNYNENPPLIIKDKILNGISLNDALIINNWLFYAKLIGDTSYKNICDQPIFSNYINNIIMKKNK